MARIGATLRPVAATAALALLGGCVSFGAAPPKQLIRLTPTMLAPAGELAPNPAAPPLLVLDPDADRALTVTRVPVRMSDTAVAYLKDAVWLDRPARQFRGLLAETIRAGNRRLVFEGSGGESGDQAVLSGRLLAMGYDATRAAVVVRFDALLTTPGAPLRTRRFEAEVPGVAADAAAVAPALNRAANRVAAQVAAWVG